jgi:predicted metal-dependent hydrolase
LRVSRDYINGLVGRKSAWIRRKLLEMSKKPKAEAKEFSEGEEFWHLGARYRLCIVREARQDIELSDRLYKSERVMSKAGEALKQWYKAEALKIITARIARYIEITGYRPLSIKISDAKRRWGSCSRKGTLNFSWRAIMAPPDVVDYLLVHELVHIGHLNHSKQFWDRVREILPDYKEQEQWLRENDRMLVIFS